MQYALMLPARLDAVLAVLYLIYNEGYSGRVDLAAEVIRLGQVLTELMPDEPEALGLLPLMMIHHAWRRARFCGEDLVLLDADGAEPRQRPARHRKRSVNEAFSATVNRSSGVWRRGMGVPAS